MFLSKKIDAIIVVIILGLICSFLVYTNASIEKLSIVAGVLISLSLLWCVLLVAEHYAYYFLIPLVPFSQSVPIFSLGSRSINLGIDTIFISILVVWHVFTNKKKIKLFSKPNRLGLILVCWLIWNISTIFISSLYLTTNQIAENFIVLLRWGQYVPIFIILSNGKLNFSQSKNAILILSLSGIVAAGLGFYQIFNGLDPLYFKGAPSFTAPLFREPDPSDILDENGNYMGSANYNVVGAYLVIVILMSISYFASAVKMHVKLFGCVAVLIMIGGVVITFSRSSIIALTFSLMFYAYKYSRKLFINFLVIVPFSLFLLFATFRDFPLIVDLLETASNVFVIIPRVLEGEQWNSSSDVSSQVYGAALRVVGLRDSLYIFFHSPLFGYGYNAYQFYGLNNTPDNYFFQTLAETGLIGFFLMVIFFREIFRSTDRAIFFENSYFLKYFKIGLASVIIAMIIVNFTGGIFYIQKVWGIFLIVCGIWYSIVNDSKSMNDKSTTMVHS